MPVEGRSAGLAVRDATAAGRARARGAACVAELATVTPAVARMTAAPAMVVILCFRMAGNPLGFGKLVRFMTTAQSRSRGPGAAGAQRSRTATVMRVSAHSRPASSVISTSHTHELRPRCLALATPWIVPAVIGRRKLVWLD